MEELISNLLRYVRECSRNELQKLFQKLQEDMEEHDQPISEMEYAGFLFDLILDQGAYFELKRHRMLTITPQNLTANLGYAVPKEISKAGQEKLYIGNG